MKRILLLFICFATVTLYGQDTINIKIIDSLEWYRASRTDTGNLWKAFTLPGSTGELQKDTIPVIVLITLSTNRNGVAHAERGYLVMHGYYSLGFLNSKRKKYKPPSIIWDYRKLNGNLPKQWD